MKGPAFHFPQFHRSNEYRPMRQHRQHSNKTATGKAGRVAFPTVESIASRNEHNPIQIGSRGVPQGVTGTNEAQRTVRTRRERNKIHPRISHMSESAAHAQHGHERRVAPTQGQHARQARKPRPRLTRSVKKTGNGCKKHARYHSKNKKKSNRGGRGDSCAKRTQCALFAVCYREGTVIGRVDACTAYPAGWTVPFLFPQRQANVVRGNKCNCAENSILPSPSRSCGMSDLFFQLCAARGVPQAC